jgi:hypothetical protein
MELLNKSSCQETTFVSSVFLKEILVFLNLFLPVLFLVFLGLNFEINEVPFLFLPFSTPEKY